MNWIDIAFVGLIALSAVISIFRGFIREVLSLVAWVAAFYIALRFSAPMAEMLAPYIEMEPLRKGIAFLGTFFLVLILFSLINYVIAKLIEGTGLSGTDRFLGVIFGIARGAAIVVVLVMLGQQTPVAEQKMWKKSTLVPHFISAADWVMDYLPAEFSQYFKTPEPIAEIMPATEEAMDMIESTRLNPPVTEETEAQ